MFCALNGATATPRRRSHRQIPATSALLPASDVVPATSSAPRTPHPTPLRVASARSSVSRGATPTRRPTVGSCGSCCGPAGSRSSRWWWLRGGLLRAARALAVRPGGRARRPAAGHRRLLPDRRPSRWPSCRRPAAGSARTVEWRQVTVSGSLPRRRRGAGPAAGVRRQAGVRGADPAAHRRRPARRCRPRLRHRARAGRRCRRSPRRRPGRSRSPAGCASTRPTRSSRPVFTPTGTGSSTRPTPGRWPRRPGSTLEPGYLQLAAGQPGRARRRCRWRRTPARAPFTNFSYALQWLTFGAIALFALGLLRAAGAAAAAPRRAVGTAAGAGRATSSRRACGDDCGDRRTPRRAPRPLPRPAGTAGPPGAGRPASGAVPRPSRGRSSTPCG